MADIKPIFKFTDKWVKKTAYQVQSGEWAKISSAETEQENHPYLTFSSAEAFTVNPSNSTKNWDGTLYYSTDTTTWSEWDGTTAIASAEHSGEQRLYMRGSGNSVIAGTADSPEWVLTGSNISCIGNIENLLDYETVANGEHPIMGERSFYCMFDGCKSLTTAPELPATTLTDYCYNFMFRGCSSLTTAPELPATTLAGYCYYYMFSGCSSLTTAPELPATTLATYCYGSMFRGCSSLTTAPELPATTLVGYCYHSMFRNCTSLTTIPKLPAATVKNQSYRSMFMGCTNVKLSNSKTGDYQTEYRIPTSGTGTIASSYSLKEMFDDTGGTFTGTPEINTTYYTSNTVV